MCNFLIGEIYQAQNYINVWKTSDQYEYDIVNKMNRNDSFLVLEHSKNQFIKILTLTSIIGFIHRNEISVCLSRKTD